MQIRTIVSTNYFFKAMNAFYLENAPLWDQDDSWQGFQWLCADDNNANTVAFLRWDRKEYFFHNSSPP